MKIRIGLLFLLIAGCISAMAQSRTVTGEVTDKQQEKLPGVSVALKGTTQGTVTDGEGKYAIAVEGNEAVLVFSYIGYQQQEIAVSNRTRLDVVMDEKLTALDEVVVVAYGTQKKINLTGAVSSFKVSDATDIPVSNTAALLQGRMSGVTVSTFSAQPGKESDVEIKVRGIGTFGNSNPMVIIDGIEGILSSVAPNDIESISVLKDAASAAIYGVRAANGVILVTTKRGNAGENRISYSGSYGIQQAVVMPKYVNSWQWATLYNEQSDALGDASGNYTPEMLQKLKDGSAPDLFANTDWAKEVFRSAAIQNHYLSMTGGSVNSNYMASLGYMNQDGIMIGTTTNRINFRLNADGKYLDMITLGMNLAGSHQETTEPSIGTYNVFEYSRWHTRPTVPVKYKNGEWGYYDANPSMQSIKNPVHASSIPSNTTTNRFDGKVYLDIEPVKNLHFKTSFAYQYGAWTRTAFSPTYTMVDAEGHPRGPSTSKNSLSETYYFGTQWINENMITYNTIAQGHSLYFLLGESTQLNGYRQSSGYGEDFAGNNIRVLDAALKTSAKGTAEQATLRSFFGRVNYDYESRYLAELNIRRDESSRIPPKNRVGYFPSVSLGWNVAQEKFMESVEPVNMLKVRASWGQLGNQDIGYYPYAQSVDLGYNYVWGDEKIAGAAITSLANPDIKWETTTTSDIGLDLAFLKNKFYLTFDYYDKTTSDILLQLPIPYLVGVDIAPYVNAAKVSNEGFDADLGYSDKWGDWTFGAKLNFSKVNNKIMDIKGKKEWVSNSGWNINLEGHPINAYYGYIANGLYTNQPDLNEGNAKNTAGGGGLKLGDIRLVNTDGDEEINPDDRTIIGNPFPDFTYGLNLNTAYKGFDFTMFFQGVGGVDRIMMEYPTLAGNATERMWNRYSETANPSGTFPRFGNGGYNSNPSSFWIEDASYLRLKNVELGYSFAPQCIGKAKLQGLRIYVSAQNVFTFTKIKDYDPEKIAADSRGYTFPNAKTFSIGLNITL